LQANTGQLIEKGRKISRLHGQVFFNLLGGHRLDPERLIAYQAGGPSRRDYELIENHLIIVVGLRDHG
jgi:hypothetical protein